MSDTHILARSTEIHHPLGNTIVTPLLVPSFSSKGFGFNKQGESEIYNYFNVAAEVLTESMLVSAYDIAQGHLPEIEPITEITIVDSGGYETSNVHDLSTIYQSSIKTEKWEKNHLKSVLDKWSANIPAIFVNYDDSKVRCSFEQQIEEASNFLLQYRTQLKAILLKPDTKDSDFLNVKRIIANLGKLYNFDIVGFTEKELGNSLLDRMISIAKIRLAMDDINLHIPIHVFGSLDPISSPLYFLAGAEIFDGLTWLRFGYRNGVAMYIHNSIALDISIDQKYPKVQAPSLMSNFKYLNTLQSEMKKFLLEKQFSMFKFNDVFLSESYDLLRTKIGRLK
jgi:hypothetical protein